MSKHSSSQIILAIDPGPERSGWVLYSSDERNILAHGITSNTVLRQQIKSGDITADQLVIERIASYGMPVGEDIFVTCFEIGKFEYFECYFARCSAPIFMRSVSPSFISVRVQAPYRGFFGRCLRWSCSPPRLRT